MNTFLLSLDVEDDNVEGGVINLKGLVWGVEPERSDLQSSSLSGEREPWAESVRLGMTLNLTGVV